jgi:hypothetical protein
MKMIHRLPHASYLLPTSGLFALLLLATTFWQGHAVAQALRLSQTPAAVLNGQAVRQNHYDPSQMLRLAIVLAAPHPAEEQQFLADVQNRQSPSFHQFLSADEWNRRFSPAQQDEQAVVDWATSQGLTVTQRYPNRLLVDVEAKAGVIETALHVTINQYLVAAGDPQEERIAFSNDRDPQLPSNLNEIVASVQGLNSVEHMMPMGSPQRYVPTPDYVPGPVERHVAAVKLASPGSSLPHGANQAANTQTVPAPPSGFNAPSYFWASSAYDYQALMNLQHCCNPLNNPNQSPVETSIAVMTIGDAALSDVLGFASAIRLATNYQTHYIDGTYVCNNVPKADPNCQEATFDLEWVIANANSQGTVAATAAVQFYVAANYQNQTVTDLYNFMLTENLARTMSTSYGCVEGANNFCSAAAMQSIDGIFSQMVGQGWTLVAASGDRGATAGCGNALSVQFPSSDPNVVGVGGTQLAEGTVSSTYEIAWTGATATGSCASNNGGSTGGLSDTYLPPAYQTFLQFPQRAVPDVALDAVSSHALYYNGSWIGYSGTSTAAPMIAGFFAQEDAYLLSLGDKCGGSGTAPCAPLGNPDYALYLTGQLKDVAHYPFYDIVSGCNSNDITALYQLTAYCAATGYDQVTGWGSANMLQLAWAINSQMTAANGPPSLSFTGPAVNKWYRTNRVVQWSVHDSAGPNLPAGTGIAGFTQGWDSVGTDSFTEAHGGTNDLFYAGPQFPNATGGCLSLAPGVGCSGGVPSQGCHTVVVHGWNNKGQTTAGQPNNPETYGPLCFDDTPPLLSILNSATPDPQSWFNSPVTVTILSSDPGEGASGLQSTSFGVNNNCKESFRPCGPYTTPFTLKSDGVYHVVAYASDVAGNRSTATDTVQLDQTPPVTRVHLEHFDGQTKVVLNATDALSGVFANYISIDGGPYDLYLFPITLLGGKHTVGYFSRDNAGNVNQLQTTTFYVKRPL